MHKMAQDRINWDKIINAKSVQKLALKEAVKKVGNCRQLAKLMKKHPAQISKWVNKKIRKKQDLLHPASGKQMERVTKIKGLTERLCPSQKT